MLRRIFCSELIVMLVIVANATVITWMYFPGYRGDWLLEFLDKLFTVFFVLEATVKIQTFGARKYFKQGWNRFDFVLIVGSLPSLLVGIVPLPDTSFLLLLRLLRLARLLRFFQFVPHIEKILSGLGRALKASFLVLIVLAFFNFLLAIITCHFYSELSPEYFGDPLTAVYSIFQMFTVEGWNEIPAEIARSIKESGATSPQLSSGAIITFTRLYFSLVVLLGGIFGLSLANAVFVDEMTMDNNDEIEVKIDQLQKQLNEIQTLLESKINERNET